MSKVLNCKDVGMNCDFRAEGKTEDEVLRKAAEHAKTKHNMQNMTPELQQKVRGAIRDSA